jgi:hypothetical protein
MASQFYETILRRVTQGMVTLTGTKLDQKTEKTVKWLFNIVAGLFLLVVVLIFVDFIGHYVAISKKESGKPPPVESSARNSESLKTPESPNVLTPRTAREVFHTALGAVTPTTELTTAINALTRTTAELARISSKSDGKKEEPAKTWGDTLGTFGDFFGGVMNPILAFFTVTGLAFTIFLQHANISASRKQSFETTFFNMLDLHNKIVQDLHFDTATIRSLEERKALKNHHNLVQEGLIPKTSKKPEREESKTYTGRHVFSAVLKRLALSVDEDTFSLKTAYFQLHFDNNDVLGHYFRNLFQILKLIDTFSDELDDPYIYSNIVRAQLSKSELQLLFLNCLDSIVDEGQFSKLVRRYRLLEHLQLKLHPSGILFLKVEGETVRLEHVQEYFDLNGEEIFAGAYGKNKVVGEFLEKLRTDWWKNSYKIREDIVTAWRKRHEKSRSQRHARFDGSKTAKLG